MVPEPTQPLPHSSSSPPSSDQKLLDRQVRDMVNAITHRVSGIHRTTPATGGLGLGHHHQDPTTTDDEQHGIRIVTLAGTNTGATMRGDFDQDKLNPLDNNSKSCPPGLSLGDPADALGTYVNNNFQAVNNSIMLGSSYNTNDPGVHMDISDVLLEHVRGQRDRDRDSRLGRKGKKKDKESFKSDRQSDDSD